MEMKGGTLRKTIPLIVLAILFASLPSVQAAPDVETLYVDSYTGDLQTWDEINEPSPYLADESTGYVHEVKSTGAVVGYFGFADPSGSGTINSVTLYVECYGEDTNDHIDIYVDCSDGGGWVEEGIMIVDQLSYGWETLNLSARLDSWSDIQNAQIYLYYQGVGGGDDIYARRAYLYVDYTEAGTNYEREVTQAVSWAGAAERVWSLTRDISQGVSVTSDSERLATFSRAVSQSMSLVFNTFASIFTFIERTVSLAITTSFNASRFMSIIRTVSLSVTTSSTVNRFITAIRAVSQTLLAQVRDGGSLILGDPPNNPNGNDPSVFNVVNEFNTSMIMMNVLTVLATGVYLFMGRDFAWGAVATFLWFVTALAMLVSDPSNWVSARVYGAFGSIFIVLTIVSVIRRLNPEEEYFDDWG